LEQAARDRQAVAGSLLTPHTREEQLLAELYTQSLTAVLTELSRALSSRPRPLDIPQPLNLVCGGGLSRVAGLCDLVRQQFEAVAVPLELGSVRLAHTSVYTVSRGALINAELEASAAPKHRAA